MDVSVMESFGFTPKITLSEGLDQMIDIYLETTRKKKN
jgi:nucleoside-diphosphate-sugar epimerase